MSLVGLTLLCAVVAVDGRQPLPQQPLPPHVERFLEVCETSRRGAILHVEHALRGLRNERPPTPENRRRIAKLEDQLRLLKSKVQPVVPPLPYPPQTGAIGRLPRLSCHVQQVVSDDELLVRCSFPVVVTTVENFKPRRETVDQQVQFLIRGVSTRAVDEGADLEMLGVFEVVGIEAYPTAGGGSKKVLVLSAFDMRRVEPYFRELASGPAEP